MATASTGLLSEEQCQCSICLEVFSDPISTPCGHNFCKACIDTHWKDKERPQCPLCKEEFNKDLRLCVNTTLRDMVESFKIYEEAKNQTPLKPEDVPCDCCLPSKRKAAKTCLVCLASYCETHLESQWAPTLQRHQLTDPVQNLKDQIWRKHHMVLCGGETKPACTLCVKRHTVEDAHPRQTHATGNENQEAQSVKNRKQNKKAKRKNNKHRATPDSVQNSHDPNHVLIASSQYLGKFSKVPSNRGISRGRCYYEVDTRGENSWNLGVVCESLRWKWLFGPNDMNRVWIVGFPNCGKYRAKNPNERTFPDSVLVCVDYDQRLVLFCDGDNKAVIFIYHKCRFNKKLFLYCQPAPSMACPRCAESPMRKALKWLLIGFVCYVVTFALCSLFTPTEANVEPGGPI